MASPAALAESPPPEQPPAWAQALLRANAELAEQNQRLREQNAEQAELIQHLREQNQALRDEIAVLKKLSARPKIRPSQLRKDERKQRRRKRRRKRDRKRAVDRTVVVKAEQVPEGSQFKGYGDFYVQELVIKAETTRYRVEKWLTPQGEIVSGKLPGEVSTEGPGEHFGPTLRCFVLYQYYHALVTEPLILEQLHEWDVQISSGQLHRLITQGKEQFHQEKDEILRVGLRVSGHVNVDDTGARHAGKNGYCTHIGNQWFAWFSSTESKSRINFLELLRAGATDYVLCGEALEYMAAQKLPKRPLSKLATHTDRVLCDEKQWQAALKDWGITDARHVRIATEGALLGSVLSHGVNPELIIVSDDAGQFDVLRHALCWIHAERVLVRLVGFNDSQREALEQVRTALWQLYGNLKDYQAKPTSDAKLEQQFDALCTTKTCFASLNAALKRMHRNKAELLLVLQHPELPLHNNLSETDIREYVKRRKISGGTRSEDGRRGRDTFASLKKTCRKHRIRFWRYLDDRIRGTHRIPPLPELIQARATKARLVEARIKTRLVEARAQSA
jgi:hypothetical protein